MVMATDPHSPDPPLFQIETAAPPHPPAPAELHPPSTAGPLTIIASTAIPHGYPENPAQVLASKRQRRPSVRLGEIGDQPYESHPRRTKQQNPGWRLPRESTSAKSIKARSLTNLVNGDLVHESDENNDQNGGGLAKEIKTSSFDFVQPKAKAKRGTTKRVRSSWVAARAEDTADNSRDFDRESDNPEKEQSPVENEAEDWRVNLGGARVSDNDDDDDDDDEAMEMDNLRESENDRRCGSREGVRSWLIELGLSRYAPVFEIHEVDDEVLPLLTLEDLRDMGINAVGSRRKLYTAIQKLRRGFS